MKLLETFKGSINNFCSKYIMPVYTKFEELMRRYPIAFSVIFLWILCLVFLFAGLGAYPLIDVDETRYVVMSRDLLDSTNWNVLLLNGEPFLEKPPLYFWLTALSIKLFGGFSELAARLPVALLAMFSVFATYFTGKKVVSNKFGLFTSITLLTSLFFLMLSHVAIIDMVLTVFITSSIYCGLLTHFVEEKNKKYWWFAFYIFAGFGFLAKGILAIALPMVVIFAYNLLRGKVLEIFRPLNIIPGIIAFLIIALPWHIAMYKESGFEFIKQYFLYHHFARFVDSAHIGRQRPLLYFVPVFLAGFMPWTILFLAALGSAIKNVIKHFKDGSENFKQHIVKLFSVEDSISAVRLFSIVYMVVIFGIISISSTKLPTYVLPLLPAAAMFMGCFWYDSVKNDINKNMIYTSSIILATIFALAGIASTLIVLISPELIPPEYMQIRAYSTWVVYACSLIILLCLKSNKYVSMFAAHVIVALFVLILAICQIFPLIYRGGADELVWYSYNASHRNAELVTFDFPVKPSVMINYKQKVNFILDKDFKALDEIISQKANPVFVIVKNKNADNANYNDDIYKRLIILDKGVKYSLYVDKSSYPLPPCDCDCLVPDEE